MIRLLDGVRYLGSHGGWILALVDAGHKKSAGHLSPCPRVEAEPRKNLRRLAHFDGERPGRWDLVGARVTLVGMVIIMFVPCGN
jgi:hypothetical protein